VPLYEVELTIREYAARIADAPSPAERERLGAELERRLEVIWDSPRCRTPRSVCPCCKMLRLMV
jgi:hypothetical protein